MRTGFCTVSGVLALCFALSAHTPPVPGGQDPWTAAAPLNAGQNPADQTPVPLRSEPHHHLVFQNEFVRVYNVAVQPLDATLMHQHDLPYLALSLGPVDIVNAVRGKPEVRLKLQDGDIIYSPGGFAHIARTDAGITFNNVTVELVMPQGTPRNLCKQVVAGPPGACPQQAVRAEKKTSPETADDDVPYFETDEMRADVIQVGLGRDYVDAPAKQNGLLVAMTNANLDVDLGGKHITFLHAGDVLWMPAGIHRKVSDFLGTQSRFLEVSFRNSGEGGLKP